ncbi:MAG: hypothetical protein WKF75_11670 [Singulisphaera sp.]
MPTTIQVEWEPGSPFFKLVESQTSRAARKGRGSEPTEALAEVWSGVNKKYTKGESIVLNDVQLKLIIHRKVSNFYSRKDKPALAQAGRKTYEDAEDSFFSPRQSESPDQVVATMDYSEVIDEAFLDALSKLRPRRREAVLSRLKCQGAPTEDDLARRWGTTAQNVRKHAKNGLEDLQSLLAKFA